MKKLAVLLQGKVLLPLFLMFLVLAVLLAHLYVAPSCTADYVLRYQTRLSEMAGQAHQGLLEPAGEGVTAFGVEYEEAYQLPLLYGNLSHRGVCYKSSQGKVLFVCGRDGAEITKAIVHDPANPRVPPLLEKVDPAWRLEVRP